MTDLAEQLTPLAVLPRLHATSRRQVVQMLCEAIAPVAGLDERAIFDAVLIRERLSGTGVGDGVAIPHARIPGIAHPIGAFAQLEQGVDFDALDGMPADLVFLLLAPAERGADHLKALARVSRLLRRSEVRDRLRQARGVDAIMTVFQPSSASDAA